MFGVTSGTISEDKQIRLQKDLALLASLKTKTASLPKASVTLFHEPVEGVNLFNTNLSFHSIDKSINRYGVLDSMGHNVPNDNMNTNKTNLSFNLFPFHFQHDTILSFTLDTPKDMEQPYYLPHKTNESFVFGLNPHQHHSLMNFEREQQLPKEDSLMSTQKQTQEEMTLMQDFELEAAGNNNVNSSSGKEKGGTKKECLHENCDFVFRTLKQKLAHHHKMSPECKKDTVLLLTAIKSLKHLLKALNKKRKVLVNDMAYKYLLTKYEQIMRSLSLSEHVELLTGYSIQDQV